MIRGEAECRLASGERLTMKVNFATLARCAEQLEVLPGEVIELLKDKTHPRQAVASIAMLEQALRVHHPEIDEDAVGDLLLSDGDALGEALGAALAGAFGPAEGRKPANPRKPAKAGTSTRSSKPGRRRG